VKRVVAISWLLLVFYLHGNAQLRTLSGELRYEHEYQDMLADNGLLTTELRRSPILSLNLTGDLISRELLTYSLFSSLNLDYNTSRNDLYEYSANQSTWNKYNLIVNVLPLFPVKLNLSARENSYNMKSNFDALGEVQTLTREQEQRADLSVYQIPWLPTMNMSYTRNFSWTEIGEPSEVLNQTLNFGLSGSSGPGGAVSLSGVLSDFNDRIRNTDDRLFTLNFSGSKALSDQHHISVNSDYNQYSTYSNLTGSVGYSGVFSNQLRLNSGLSGNTVSAVNYEFRSAGFNEGLTYIADQNFQFGLGLRGTTGLSQSVYGDSSQSIPSSDWATSFSIQHTRPLPSLTVSNGLSLGYEVQNFGSRYRLFNAAWSNTMQIPIDRFSLIGDYTLIFNHNENSDWWNLIGNNAGIMATGTVLDRVQSQSSVRYHDEHYTGDAASFRDQQNLILNQRFTGSYTYLIPFTLGFGGSINWYFANIKGHTHSWNISFSSPSFFIRGLFANYNYARTFDVYYQKESVEQTGSLLYRWRALSFEGRFRSVSFPVRVRDFVFDIARTF